jgi:alpha/beta superfamily hydrolase
VVTTADLQIKSLSLTGPAGRLEALLNLGASQPTHTSLVCHPHPLYGGTLHNKVVFHTMKALHGFGFPVLRFNFRGAGLSEGEHDEGRGEVGDTRAALDWLAQEFALPVVFAGFSFGAAVGLRACHDDPRVPALISLATPAGPVEDRTYDFSFLSACRKPKLFLSGERDQYGPRAKLEALVAAVPEPKQLTMIPGADHFFAGRLSEMRHAIESWVPAALDLKRSI